MTYLKHIPRTGAREGRDAFPADPPVVDAGHGTREPEGRRAGELCGAAGTDRPIDAALALLARPGDWVLTSGPDDLRRLVAAAGAGAQTVAV